MSCLYISTAVAVAVAIVAFSNSRPLLVAAPLWLDLRGPLDVPWHDRVLADGCDGRDWCGVKLVGSSYKQCVLTTRASEAHASTTASAPRLNNAAISRCDESEFMSSWAPGSGELLP